MTSVNSPACLLARNHFYRNLPSGSEASSTVFSCQNESVTHKQRQVTLCIAMATPPGLPAGLGTKNVWVNIDLRFSPPPLFSNSKPTDPVDRGVK